MCLRVPVAAPAAKSLQSCPTLCDPIDISPPGFPVPGILQARTLEWVAISFSNAWKWKLKVKSLSRVWLLATPWTTAYQAPPSMGFSRQKYWSGVPLPSPKGISKPVQINKDSQTPDTWVGKIPQRRKWQPTPVFLPGKSYGQRSQAGYGPWGHTGVGHDLVTKQQKQQRNGLNIDKPHVLLLLFFTFLLVCMKVKYIYILTQS